MKGFISLVFLNLAAAQKELPHKVPEGRIVGGYEVSPKFKYPWMVSLQKNSIHTCGGTLFNKNTVISAAHCVKGTASDWKAAVKRHDISLSKEVDGGAFYAVNGFVSHPNYDTNNEAFDISIWKISGSDSLESGIKLDVGNRWSNADNTLLKVIGWGITKSGTTSSRKLMEVKVPVFNADKCKLAYSWMDNVSQFCAGYSEGGKDSCQGDSGGPLFIDEDNATLLVGVVSWGLGCAQKNRPGVYTRTGGVVDWINQNSQ